MQMGRGFFTPMGESVLQIYKDLCDLRPQSPPGSVSGFINSVQLQLLSSLSREDICVHDTDDSWEPLWVSTDVLFLV